MWLIDNYMISNKNKLITSIITNLKTALANNFKESIVICPCQVSKIDQVYENDIKKILDKIIYNQEWIISKNKELSKTMVDVNNTKYNIEDNNLVRVLELIYKKMAIEK